MKYKLFHIKVKDLVFWSLAIITSAIMSCSNTDSLITDPEVVRQDSINQSILDNQAIDDYIAAKGFAYVFSSSTGIRYVFLKEGNGQTPNLNDIVSIDYVGKNLSDVVFDTSNTQAAIDAEIYTEGRSYSPIRFNLTSNGSGLAGFVSGFLEGVTKILLETDDNGQRLMTTGGKALLLIPSVLAYGDTGTSNAVVPANTVIAFEITLVSVRP